MGSRTYPAVKVPDRVGVTGLQRGEVAARNPGLRPRVAGSAAGCGGGVDRQLAAVRAEPADRSSADSATTATGHAVSRTVAPVGQQLDHGPATHAGGGHLLDPGRRWASHTWCGG